MPPSWIALLVIFVIAGTVEVLAHRQLYRALRARQPELYEPEYAWADRIQARPSTLIREVATTSIGRLRMLTRSSRYPEVERLRRLALLSTAVAIAAFVGLAVVR